ncbi:MAG: DUF4071 domain-containing protein [Planctomycetes bacterium]|nr:DUF4071 domain-containing protein [Planctomycetota bacterium]
MPRSPSDGREMCFVLMPFGTKPDPSGRQIDFDAVYGELVRPAVEDAGLRPLRSDEEGQGGVIHKQMFERLLLCPYAVADLSTANPNVYYELGVRHAARPHTTVMIHSSESDLRFDVSPVRSSLYHLDPKGRLSDVEADRRNLERRLREALGHGRRARRDSPIFELFSEAYRAPELPHEVCDTFFERVQMSETTRIELERLRTRYRAARDDDARDAVRTELRTVLERCAGTSTTEAATWTALLLTCRACDDLDGMLLVVATVDETLGRQRLFEQQHAFALNRLGRGDEARAILERLMREHGADPETCGLLGRVHKDAWKSALAAGDDDGAAYHLRLAIDTYLRGFLADWRDFYPGVNALTLMDAAGDARFSQYLPIVTFSTRRRLETRPEERQDYWEHAAMLEIAVLTGDRAEAQRWLPGARMHHKEPWELRTTADQLRTIATRRRGTGTDEQAAWIDALADRLAPRA